MQLLKAPRPIEVTLFGIFIVVKPVQAEKAFLPIEVTLLGIVTEVRPVKLMKAPSPMEVTLFGINEFLQPAIKVLVDVSMMALQLSRESYVVLPDATVIVVKLMLPAKGVVKISFTVLGIVTDIIPVHSLKA